MDCLQELQDSRVLKCGVIYPVSSRTVTATQHAIDPRTGEELRFGPAMAEKAVGVDMPALRKLFADIQN